MQYINIARDFSDTPGGRYVAEGDYSGEAFRDTLLLPKYEVAEHYHEQLEINFDGCWGFSSGFLEEAFGGLIRKLHRRISMDNRLVLISMDDPTLPVQVEGYIYEAERLFISSDGGNLL